jgi:hypothetical protein
MSLSKAARNVMAGRQQEALSEETSTPKNDSLPKEGKLASKPNAPKAQGKPGGPPPVSTTVKPTGGVNSDDAKKVAHQTKKSAEPQAAKKTGDSSAPDTGQVDATPSNKKLGEDEELYYDEGSEELVEDEDTDDEEYIEIEQPDTKLGQAKAIFDALREMDGDELDEKYALLMTAIYEDLAEDDEDSEESYEIDMHNSEAAHITAEDLDVDEDIRALMGEDNDLSEEFMGRARVIFEGAVVSKVNETIDVIHAQYEKDLEESVSVFAEELTEKVDGYLSYAVEEWMKENELAIESGIKTEVTENFINGLKSLFIEHYIDIPEESVDVLEALAGKTDELESGLNEAIEQNITLQQEINESRKFEILVQSCDGLADTQIEKLRGLAEGVEFEDVDQYQDAINTLKEGYFPKAPRTNNAETEADQALLNEDVEGETAKPRVSREMAAYANVLGRTIRK